MLVKTKLKAFLNREKKERLVGIQIIDNKRYLVSAHVVIELKNNKLDKVLQDYFGEENIYQDIVVFNPKIAYKEKEVGFKVEPAVKLLEQLSKQESTEVEFKEEFKVLKDSYYFYTDGNKEISVDVKKFTFLKEMEPKGKAYFFRKVETYNRKTDKYNEVNTFLLNIENEDINIYCLPVLVSPFGSFKKCRRM